MTMAAALLALAGCSNEENEVTPDNWNGEIRLSSGLDVQQVTRSIATDLQGDKINTSVKVGIFINEDTQEGGTTTTTYTQNMEYTADGNNGLSTSVQPYYPQSGAGVNIFAYAPRNASYASGISGSMSFTVASDQSTDAQYLASDLLWGQPMKEDPSSSGTYISANPVERTSNAVGISFKHLLSKIEVTLKPGSGLTTEDFKGAKLTVLQVKPTTALTMNSGTIATASGNATEITAATYPTDSEPTLTASAVLVPQAITENTKFLKVHLTTGGDLFYTVEKGKGFSLESGKVYKYEITVKLTGLTVTSSIKDWESIGANPVTGEAVME